MHRINEDNLNRYTQNVKAYIASTHLSPNFGNNNVNTGLYGLVAGDGNLNLGINDGNWLCAVVFGRANVNDGKNSLIAGSSNTNKREGYDNMTSNSLILGNNNENNNSYSVIYGRYNKNYSQCGFVSGLYLINGYSDVNAKGNYTTTACSTVIGKYNKILNNALFTVGNGTTIGNRKNAFVVYEDGRAEVQSTPINDKDVLRRIDIIDIIYPVGSIYITISPAFDPNNVFGGTWVVIEDAYLYAKLSAETAGNVYGNYLISVDLLPEHSHNIDHGHTFTGTLGETDRKGDHDHSGTQSAGEHSHTYSIKESGTGTSNMKLPEESDNGNGAWIYPSTNAAGDHWHKISQDGDHVHKYTPSGTISNHSGNSGSTGSNNEYKPKYLAVIVWKRTV